MRWTEDRWEHMSARTIENCWEHIGILREQDKPAIKPLESLATVNEDTEYIKAAIRSSVAQYSRIDISQFLNPVGEDDVIQDIGEDALVAGIVADLSDTEPSSSNN